MPNGRTLLLAVINLCTRIQNGVIYGMIYLLTAIG